MAAFSCPHKLWKALIFRGALKLIEANFSNARLNSGVPRKIASSEDTGSSLPCRSNDSQWLGAALGSKFFEVPSFCMWETQLIDANLKGASLINADIGRSNFTGADVTDANFNGVRCDTYTGLDGSASAAWCK